MTADNLTPAISERAISDPFISGFTYPGAGKLTLTGYPIALSSGTVPLFDPAQTVISQYANSPILLSIIQSFYSSEDQSADMDMFYNLVWNVSTAVGWGLDVWGRIVGVNRYLYVQVDFYFGMEKTGIGASGDPFNQNPFYNGGNLTENFALTDDVFRQLILAKAAANITNGSVAAINNILRTVFPSDVGNAYVEDNQDMTMTYKFTFVPTPVQQSILFQSGVLPAMTGVTVLYDVP